MGNQLTKDDNRPEVCEAETAVAPTLVIQKDVNVNEDDDDDFSLATSNESDQALCCDDKDEASSENPAEGDDDDNILLSPPSPSSPPNQLQQHPLCVGWSLLVKRRTDALLDYSIPKPEAPASSSEDDTLSCRSTTTSSWSLCSPAPPAILDNKTVSGSTAPRRINSWLTFPSSISLQNYSTWGVGSSCSSTTEANGVQQAAAVDHPDQGNNDVLEDSPPTAASDLRNPQKPIWIVTTAALPWMTGTAVNPCLRAAYLTRYRQQQEREMRSEQQKSHRERRMVVLEGEDAMKNEAAIRDIDTAAAATTTTATTAAPVHLVLPWLESAEDRVALYGPDWKNKTCQDQTAYIETWLKETAGMPDVIASSNNDNDGQQATSCRLILHFYPARYHSALSSIFAMGDVCAQLNAAAAAEQQQDNNSNKNASDENVNKAILILEEPEHLNYYRAPSAATSSSFGHVIGICHTNYKYYAQQHVTGFVAAPIVSAVSAGLVRAYCDQIIKLSAVLQDYAPYKEVVSNVHGIRHDFFEASQPKAGGGVYFLGKLLWAKGLDRLLVLQRQYHKHMGCYFPMHVYGSGPEQDEIERAYAGNGNQQNRNRSSCGQLSSMTTTTVESSSAEVDEEQKQRDSPEHGDSGDDDSSKGSSSSSSAVEAATTPPFRWTNVRLGRYHNQDPLPVKFCGRIDHAAVGSDYKIFVNPSVSEVLCTTTAEALAMGKFVILPYHVSNAFFMQFANALFYSTPDEFVARLNYALDEQHQPEPVANATTTAVSLHPLSWEAATERLLQVATVSERDAARRQRLRDDDAWLAKWHYEICKGRTGDVLRKVLGGGPVAEQAQYQKECLERSMVLCAAAQS